MGKWKNISLTLADLKEKTNKTTHSLFISFPSHPSFSIGCMKMKIKFFFKIYKCKGI